jgi:hypothetical protein
MKTFAGDCAVVIDAEEYQEELDRAWRAVDALGGVGATPSQETALNDVIAAIEALGGMDPVARRRLERATVLNVRPGENSLERFERIASAFYRETGLLAPGKDAPAAGGQPDHEERRARFDAWIDEKTNGQ